MTDQRVELDTCPRGDCDDPILEAFRTDRPFQLQPRNVAHLTDDGDIEFTHDKWCVIPRLDAEAEKLWVYVIIHGELEGFKRASELDEGDEAGPRPVDEAEGDVTDVPEGDDDAADVDVLDPADLPAFERDIYDVVDREGPVSLAAIQGATALRRDKSLEEVGAAVEWLAEQGYIHEETADEYVTTDA